MRACLILLAALTATAASAQVTLDGRRCATAQPSVAEVLESMAIVERHQLTADLRTGGGGPVTVPVAVHVLMDQSGQGDIPEARIQAQIDTLNSAFASTGYRFALALVERVTNDGWYTDLALDSPEERDMKATLARDPARFLNLYTASLALDYLGWAYLPSSGSERFVQGGVVLLDESLPGGSASPYNLGHTGTHEVGHWAGLLHTFAGGCSEPNDGVADTPQERSGASGCPTGRDSCPLDPGPDPIQNYMDYSADACMTGFTEGQGTRSRALVAQFRPTLSAGGFAVATLPRGGVEAALAGGRTTLRVANATSESVEIVSVTVRGADLVASGELPDVPLGAAAAVALVPGVPSPPPPPPAGAFTVTAVDPLRPDVEVDVVLVAVLPPSARVASAPGSAQLIQEEATEGSFRLANDGPGPLQFAVDTASLPPFVASVTPSEGLVPAGGEVTLAVTYTTAGLDADDYAGAILIRTNDPSQLVLEVPVSLTVILRPARLAVGPAYPNPGSGDVFIPLELPDDTEGIDIAVFDAQGRRVAVLGDGLSLPVGYPVATWDARTAPAGLYIVRVITPRATATASVVVAR